MRLLPIIISVVLLSSFSFTDSLYNYSFASIDGTTHLFSEYQGKKIWIVILPSSQTADDSAFLIRVDSIAQSNASQLITIAVPSYEDGYNADTLNAFLPWYQSIISNSVVLTQGMYTHKSSGTLQNPLFSWLTTTTLNNHFEEEVGGPGEMYFINEQGELNGVFGPDVKWSNKIVNRMLQ